MKALTTRSPVAVPVKESTCHALFAPSLSYEQRTGPARFSPHILGRTQAARDQKSLLIRYRLRRRILLEPSSADVLEAVARCSHRSSCTRDPGGREADPPPWRGGGARRGRERGHWAPSTSTRHGHARPGRPTTTETSVPSPRVLAAPYTTPPRHATLVSLPCPACHATPRCPLGHAN